MRRIVLFIFCFGLWILLVWPVDAASGGLQTPDVITGVLVSLLVALVMREFTTQKFYRWISPVRIFWAILYLFVLAYHIIKANLDVAYRVLHPAMPIHPGIVKVRTRLKTPTALAVLANSITLTPGTHTVDVLENGFLYVHWINVKTSDVDEASRYIVTRYEGLLKRIFE